MTSTKDHGVTWSELYISLETCYNLSVIHSAFNSPSMASITTQSFPTTSFGIVHVVRHNYINNGALAIELVDAENESVVMLSVNLPEVAKELGPDEFFVKTWSENQEIAQDARRSGIFEITRRTSSDFLRCPIWKLLSQEAANDRTRIRL